MIKKEPYIGMPIILDEIENTAMTESIGESLETVKEEFMDLTPKEKIASVLKAADTGEPAEAVDAPAAVTAAAPAAEDAPAVVNAAAPAAAESAGTFDETALTAAAEMPNRQPMVVGMAYVPWQRWQQPFDYETAFEKGTIFPDLDLPFLGYMGGRRR